MGATRVTSPRPPEAVQHPTDLYSRGTAAPREPVRGHPGTVVLWKGPCHCPGGGDGLRAATWNVRAQGNLESKVNYLQSKAWDVACLQEITEGLDGRLAGCQDWDRFTWITAGVPRRKMKFLHGVGIVARNGWRIVDGRPMGGLPFDDRGLCATVASGEETVQFISFHAPYATGDRSTKITAYQRLTDVINETPDPLVVGMDANHWETSAELGLEPAPAPDSKYFVENGFFSSDAPHRLQDSLRAYLAEHPEEYANVRAQRPEGPLAVTYVRGRGDARTADRFDHLMVSPGYEVSAVVTDYDGATAAGSDHAYVEATLATASPG